MLHDVTSLFGEMDRAGILYCVMRDAEPAAALERAGEIDVLVNPLDVERAAACLVVAGFVRLPAWGHAPHQFFVRYDEPADRWLKVDIVTAVAYGRPTSCMGTDLAHECLAARRHTGVCHVPCVEDELITLLLHGLLDKRAYRAEHVARIRELRRRVSREGRLQAHLGRYWPGLEWPQLSRLIDAGDWERLLADGPRVAAHLSGSEPWRTIGRAYRDRVLRRLRRWVGMARPLAPSVALLAPDGAGKSTLVEGMQGRFFQPVHAVYMGRYSKGSRRSGRRILPGLGVARHVAAQWHRYLSARYRQAGGQLVLFDRYTYDALLPAPGASGPLRRLRRWVLARACPAPDLVVLLDAPGDVLFARKGEHSPDVLERQRQSYLGMRPRFPRSVVVDVRGDPMTVRRAVTALVWDEYRRRACH